VGYTTLLFLHVLGAFTMVAGAGMFVAILLASQRHPESGIAIRFVPAATVIWGVGSVAAIVFGIWLAIHVNGYSLTDGWILAAIILWAAAGALGGRIGRGYRSLKESGSLDPQAVSLHLALVAIVLVILVDMIYKPGA
jgi:uncharacterized membrane protein